MGNRARSASTHAPRQAIVEQVHLQRIERRYEDVDSKVELVVVDEVGVLEVLLRDQVLGRFGHRRPCGLGDEGDAAPTRRRRWLQDPDGLIQKTIVAHARR